MSDDFDKYVTSSAPRPRRQREFRTDRNNNPIAAAVTTGGTNQFTQALDDAEIPWEHGDPFPNNPKLSTIKIKGDPYEGARAILSNSNALKWYRSSTGKSILPKYNVRSNQDFAKLPVEHQNDIINNIYQTEGGHGTLKPTNDDFDKYVSTDTPQQAAPDDDFDKYVTSGAAPKTPQVTSTIKDETGEELPTETPKTTKPIEFQGTGTIKPNSLNPVENIANILNAKKSPQATGLPRLQSEHYQTPKSEDVGERVKIPFKTGANPNPDEVVQGFLSEFGPEYAELGKRYKAETGQNILNLTDSQFQREPDGSYYVRPSRGAVDYINAYGQGGLEAADKEAARQHQEYAEAQKKATEESKPDIKAAEAAVGRTKGDDLSDFALRGATSGMGRAAQAVGSVLPESVGGFKRKATVMRAAAEESDKLNPANTRAEKAAQGLGESGPGLMMLGAAAPLGSAMLPTLGALEGSTPEERLSGGLQGAAMQATFGLGPHLAPNITGLPAKALTGATMAEIPTGEAVARGEDPWTALVSSLPYVALPFLHKSAKENPELPEVQAKETLGIERAPVVPDAESVLANREASVKPTFLRDDQGNAVARVLNPDEVAEGAKPKIRPVHTADVQARDETGKFVPAVEPQAELSPSAQSAGSLPETVSPEGVAGVAPSLLEKNSVNAAKPSFIPSAETKPTPELSAAPPPVPEGHTRFFRADHVDATEPLGKGWAPRDPEYVSQKYGKGQMGSETIWYRDVPNSEIDAEYHDHRAASILNTEALDRMKGSEPKLYRRVVQPSTSDVFQNPEPGTSIRDQPKSSASPSAREGEKARPNTWMAPYLQSDMIDQLRQPEGYIHPEVFAERQAVKVKALPQESETKGETNVIPPSEKLPSQAVDTSGSGGLAASASTVPETPETLAAQIEALKNGTRDAVLITQGEQRPKLPERMAAEKTDAGVFYFDPKKVSRETIRAKVADGTHGELLGHVVPKPELGEPTAVVTAKNSEGTEVQSSAVPLEKVNEQVAATQAQNPDAQVTVGGNDLAQKVLGERQASTTAKNDSIVADRAELDLPDLPDAERKGWQKSLDNAKVKGLDARASALADEILRKPRAFNDEETAGVVLRLQDIKNQHAQLLNEIGASDSPGEIESKSSQLQGLEDEFDRLTSAVKASGTEKGRSLAAQKLTINRDYDLVSMLNRYKAATKRPLTDSERTQIDRMSKRLNGDPNAPEGSPARKGLEAAYEEAQRELVKKSAEKVIGEQQREARRARRQVNKDALESEAALIKQNIAAEFARLKSRQASTQSLWGLGSLDPDGVITRELAKYVRNKAKAGVLDAAQIIDDAHAMIKEFAENVTRRQVEEAIAGYGRPVKQRAELENQIAQLKSQMRKELAAADVAAGIRSPRNEGPRLSDARQVPLQGPRMSEARQSGVPLQGPKLSDANKLKMEGPRMSEAPKVGPKTTKDAIQNRYQKQIDELQRRITEGDFSEKPQRGQIVYDRDTENLKLQANRLKRQFDGMALKAKSEADWKQRGLVSKGTAYAAAGTRAAILSGVKTIGKIGSALAQRTIQQYPEEGAAKIAGRLAPGTAEKATRYGGHLNLETEKRFATGFGAGVKEIPHILKTGESELAVHHGDFHPGVPTKIGRALEVPGRIHFSEKNPLLRGEYERSKEALLQHADRVSPGSRNDPTVVDAAEEEAYKNAKEVILMGDNPISGAFTRMVRGMGQKSQDLARTIVPVNRVAGNYLTQMIRDYGTGLARGTVRAMMERDPERMKNLTHAEAEKTMRMIQRGALGVVYMALAGTPVGVALGIKFGGFYKPGRKDEVKPQDVKVGPATVSHMWLHSPPDELGQLAASMQQEWDARKDVGRTRAIWNGAARSGKGIADQTPLLNEVMHVGDSLRDGGGLSSYLGRMVASRVEPQALQEGARLTDRFEGQPVNRKPKGFTDQLKMGVPGLRQTVPISNLFGSQATKASNEVQRLEISLHGAVKEPDETPEDFKKREAIQNGNIRTQLENVVALPEYDKASDADKKEWLKQASAFASQQTRESLPEKPEKAEKKQFPMPVGFERAYPATALDKFERMNAPQRAKAQDSMAEKAWLLTHSPTLSDEQKESYKARLDKLKIVPRPPNQPKMSTGQTYRSQLQATQ